MNLFPTGGSDVGPNDSNVSSMVQGLVPDPGSPHGRFKIVDHGWG